MIWREQTRFIMDWTQHPNLVWEYWGLKGFSEKKVVAQIDLHCVTILLIPSISDTLEGSYVRHVSPQPSFLGFISHSFRAETFVYPWVVGVSRWEVFLSFSERKWLSTSHFAASWNLTAWFLRLEKHLSIQMFIQHWLSPCFYALKSITYHFSWNTIFSQAKHQKHRSFVASFCGVAPVSVPLWKTFKTKAPQSGDTTKVLRVSGVVFVLVKVYAL